MSILKPPGVTAVTPNDLLVLAAMDLGCYALAQPTFDMAEHLKIVIGLLASLERRELMRLIINLPPRHGKTWLVSILFAAWYLGRHPDHQVIGAAYGAELADENGRRIRNILASPLHEAIFRKCRLSQDSSAANRFATTAGGGYIGVGRGGPMTGRGADLLLLDDLVKDGDEARSPTIQRQSRNWFSEVVYPRLMPGGVIVFSGTRWHQRDLVGQLLEEQSGQTWHVLSMPAIAERDEGFRAKGEPLWKKRFPLPTLEAIRQQIGSAAFASLYQQRPVPAEGSIFRAEWFREYFSRPSFRRIVQSWDTAFKTGSDNDYSCCVTLGEAEDGYYVLAVWRGKVDFPRLKQLVSEFADLWKPDVILVEDSASGQPLIQELMRISRLPIKGVRPKGDKIARANAVSALVEAGKLLVPAAAGWKDEYLDELCTFPVSAHDDYVDATTQALQFLRDSSAGASTLPPPTGRGGPAPCSERELYARANMVELPAGYISPSDIRGRLG